MSLLAQVNQPTGILSDGKPQYYFALDQTPDDPDVVAPAFVATGIAPLDPVGTFTARGDGIPAGIDMFNMATSAGTIQWSTGMIGTAAGANSGNNFALLSYDDNGAPIAAPITVNRATGDVIMTGNLVVAEDLTAENVNANTAVSAGVAATVGGGIIQANGPSGLSRVYDPIYNPVGPGVEVLLSQFDKNGNAIGSLVPYTPAKSGLYCLTMEVRVDNAGGWTWANGTNVIVGYLGSVAPPFAPLTDSLLACDALANPSNLFIPAGYPAGVYVKDQVALVNLVAGTAYVPSIAVNTPAINLGTTGGVRFFIQPMVA